MVSGLQDITHIWFLSIYVMWTFIGTGLIEVLFVRVPALAAEVAVQGGVWLVSRTYSWCYSNKSKSYDVHAELERIKFELDEIRNPEWIIVE